MPLPSFAEEVLRPLMVDKGWNQSELARQLEVNPSMVSLWMNGEFPDTTNMNRLAALCDFDPKRYVATREFVSFRKKLKKEGIDFEQYRSLFQ